MFYKVAILLSLCLCIGPGAACKSESARHSPLSGSVPQRIITIGPSAAEIIAALGEASRLLAVSKFCVYPPELADLPRVGGLFDPDLELILRLNPDLLVLRGHNPELERICKDRGIRLHYDPTEAYEDIFTAIRQLGEILGRPEEAAELASEIRARIAKIETAIKGRPRPRVFFSYAIERGSLAHVATAGKNTFIDKIITIAGGENVFGSLDVPYPEVSLEDILAARPEVILEAMPERTPTRELRERIMRRWQDIGPIPAVAEGHIHIMTEDHLLIPSPRVVDTIERVARLLHPEVSFD